MFTFWAKLLDMRLAFQDARVTNRNMLFFRIFDKGFSLLNQALHTVHS